MPALVAKLVSSDAGAQRREIRLSRFPLRLGRTTPDGVCIDDRWVSREHCEIACENGALVIRDLGSKHGTYVNGQPVTRAELHSGDELSLGLTRFIVHCGDPAASAGAVREAFA